jgi:hypothetical protein
MISFTFNLLDRYGLAEIGYFRLSNFINKNVLKRNTLNTQLIADAFTAVDGFWLKHGRTKWYSESDIRVIVGSVVESLRDNELTSREVRTLVKYITAKWKPEIAESKATADTSVLIPSPVENNALRAVEVWKQIPTGLISTSDFISLGSRAIAENLPDTAVVSGVLSALGLK